jgi:hypothetical protein
MTITSLATGSITSLRLIFVRSTDTNHLQTIAKHVLNIHMDRSDINGHPAGEIDIDKMKKYIAYCKWYANNYNQKNLWLPDVDLSLQGNAHHGCQKRLWRR